MSLVLEQATPAPLAANIAAKIVRIYPGLRMQTVKALIINSANELDNRYLLPLIDTLKAKDNPDYPSVDKKEKTKLSLKYSSDLLGHYLSGYGSLISRNVCILMIKG